MKKCNIFVVGGSTGYTSWIENVNLVDSPLKADIVYRDSITSPLSLSVTWPS